MQNYDEQLCPLSCIEFCSICGSIPKEKRNLTGENGVRRNLTNLIRKYGQISIEKGCICRKCYDRLLKIDNLISELKQQCSKHRNSRKRVALTDVTNLLHDTNLENTQTFLEEKMPMSSNILLNPKSSEPEEMSEENDCSQYTTSNFNRQSQQRINNTAWKKQCISTSTPRTSQYLPVTEINNGSSCEALKTLLVSDNGGNGNTQENTQQKVGIFIIL